MITPTGNANAQTIVAILHHQHGYVEEMLATFERELSIFESGGSPDYELIEQVIACCIDCLNSYHQATEEPLLKTLFGQNIVARAKAEAFEAEYVQIVEAARRIAAAIQAVFRDVEVYRQTLSEIAHGFLDSCRRHINTEERILFPAAVANFRSSDWGVVAEAISAQADEACDRKARAAYGPLCEGIIAAGRSDLTR